MIQAGGKSAEFKAQQAGFSEIVIQVNNSMRKIQVEVKEMDFKANNDGVIKLALGSASIQIDVLDNDILPVNESIKIVSLTSGLNAAMTSTLAPRVKISM